MSTLSKTNLEKLPRGKSDAIAITKSTTAKSDNLSITKVEALPSKNITNELPVEESWKDKESLKQAVLVA